MTLSEVRITPTVLFAMARYTYCPLGVAATKAGSAGVAIVLTTVLVAVLITDTPPMRLAT